MTRHETGLNSIKLARKTAVWIIALSFELKPGKEASVLEMNVVTNNQTNTRNQKIAKAFSSLLIINS